MSKALQILVSRPARILAIVIILIVSSIHILSNLLDVEKYRQFIIDEISSITNKKVVINGPLSLDSIPILNIIKINIPNVIINEEKDGKIIDFLEAQSIIIETSMIDFFLNKIQLQTLEIKNAKFNFESYQINNQIIYKNWDFMYDSNSKKLTKLNNINVSNASFIYKDIDSNYSYEKVNFTIKNNQNDGIEIKGNLPLYNGNSDIISKISTLKQDNSREIQTQITNDGARIELQGSLIEMNNSFQMKANFKMNLTKPNIISHSLIKIAPFINSMTQVDLKDPLTINGKLNYFNKFIELIDLKISSHGTNGIGDMRLYLGEEKDKNNFLNFKFDNIDISNFISFNGANLVKAFSDKALSDDNNVISPISESSYINFALIDNENIDIKLIANKIEAGKINLQNLNFDFSTKTGLINSGNLSFGIQNNKHTANIKLSNLTFQKVDNIHLLLGDFNNEGSNVNETLKLLSLNDVIDIKGEKLDYNISSKIILSAKEISIFEILGKIGEHGSFNGSIASTHDEMSHYNLDLKFNDFELTNFSMPLIKQRISTLISKSKDDDYLSYFRWFRTLPSSYRIKLEFINAEIQDEKIDRLLLTCKLSPGIMSFKMDLKSGVADGVYQADVSANQLKPALDLKVNSLHLDFDRFKSLAFGFLDNEDSTITNSATPSTNNINTIWPNDNLNIFRIYKYKAHVDFSVQDLKFGANQMNNFRAIGHTSNDVFYIDNWYFKAYGGEFQTQGNISFFDQLLYQFSFTTSGMKSEAILEDFFPNISGIKGAIASTGSIITKGESLSSLVSNLNISGNFIAPSLTINGIDSDGIVDVALRRQNVDKNKALTSIDTLLNNGTTDVSGLNGSFKASKGFLTTNDINFKTRFSSAVFAMSLDLNSLAFSSQTQFFFTPYSYKNNINYSVSKSGDLKGNIEKTIDEKDLVKYVKWQYGIVTAEDVALAKKLALDQKKYLSEDPDNKDYLYYKLQQQSDANKDSESTFNKKQSILPLNIMDIKKQ